VVAAAEQRMHRRMDPLLAAGKAQDGFGGSAVIVGGDGLAQPGCAARIGVAELHRLPALPILGIGHGQQLRQRQGLGIGRR
jgi:hypothetical protein